MPSLPPSWCSHIARHYPVIRIPSSSAKQGLYVASPSCAAMGPVFEKTSRMQQVSRPHSPASQQSSCSTVPTRIRHLFGVQLLLNHYPHLPYRLYSFFFNCSMYRFNRSRFASSVLPNRVSCISLFTSSRRPFSHPLFISSGIEPAMSSSHSNSIPNMCSSFSCLVSVGIPDTCCGCTNADGAAAAFRVGSSLLVVLGANDGGVVGAGTPIVGVCAVDGV